MMDLRSEFNNLLTQDEAIGRWIVIRHFSTEHSEFWKPQTNEGVGGPPFKYTDIVVEAYSVPIIRTLKTQGVNIQSPSSIEDVYDRFFFHHTVIIDVNDEIFDLDYFETNKPTMVLNESEVNISKGYVLPTNRFKVKTIYTYRGDRGRIEYKAADSFKTVMR